MTNKKALSESDICDRYITPALIRSGWTSNQWRREYFFTDGKIIVRGKLVARGKRKRLDYLLFHTLNVPIALIEAKDNNHSVGSGMQQGLAYAETLDVPFVFSSNGDGFLFHDRTGGPGDIEQILTLDQFPSPDLLWSRTRTASLQTVPELKPLKASGMFARSYVCVIGTRMVPFATAAPRRSRVSVVGAAITVATNTSSRSSCSAVSPRVEAIRPLDATSVASCAPSPARCSTACT